MQALNNFEERDLEKEKEEVARLLDHSVKKFAEMKQTFEEMEVLYNEAKEQLKENLNRQNIKVWEVDGIKASLVDVDQWKYDIKAYKEMVSDEVFVDTVSLKATDAKASVPKQLHHKFATKVGIRTDLRVSLPKVVKIS